MKTGPIETTDYDPLVSVVVITYNSAEYVVETLDSILSQSYKNIELIVSDDSSLDETTGVVSRWIETHGSHFKRTELCVAKENRGVSENCNQGLMLCRGEWVKLIAGDDILESNAIETYIKYVSENPNIKAVISDMNFFGEMTGLCPIDRRFGKLNAGKQLRHLLVNRSPNFGPSGFSHRITHLEIGGYDTTCRSIEDYPMALRFAKNNIRIHHLEKPLVRYRMRTGSLSGSQESIDRAWAMYSQLGLPLMKERHLYLMLFHHHIDKFIYVNRMNFFLKYRFFQYILKSFDMYAWILFFRKRCG